MISVRSFVAAAAAMAALLCTVPGHAQTGQRFKIVEIIDHNGFERPMPAARIMIPMEWAAQGGVTWHPQAGCSADGSRHEWTAGDPRTGMAVEIIPATAWMSNNLPIQVQATGGCPTASIRTAKQFLEALVAKKRPGAAILDYRDRPDLAATMSYAESQQNLMGSEHRMWVEAGEILIGYRYQSRDMRESIAAAVIFSLTRMAGVMPGEIREFLSGSSMPAFAMRAPDGALDFKLQETIRKSITPDPEWQARMNKHNTAMARINAKGAADRSRIATRTNQEVGDMMMESWKRQQGMIDRGHEKFSRAIREQDLYHDPQASTQHVELPSTYSNAWRLRDGTYMMTDDSNFDPNVHLGMGGTRLQRAE